MQDRPDPGSPPPAPQAAETLDCAAFWLHHDAGVVAAPRHSGAPIFYPVYRMDGLYSFSMFRLLRERGHVTVNPALAARLAEPDPGVVTPEMTIDAGIARLGGPPALSRRQGDPAAFAAALARAMQADAAAAEAANPGTANLVLCGGRDSLNLLLLDWQNPVVALSAAPNLALVREFVARNDLDIRVEELRDIEDPGLAAREIAEACCQVDLTNWKWTAHLRRIAADHDRRAVFWKGQFADAFLTDYWRSYTGRRSRAWQFAKKGYRKAARAVPGALQPLLAPADALMLRDFRDAIWRRGAVLQGAHMGFLRSITDCLVLSAYHGPETAGVWLSADLPRVARGDLRPAIGRCLAGREVWYPGTNPSPPASTFRRGWRDLDRFREAMAEFGIEVRG